MTCTCDNGILRRTDVYAACPECLQFAERLASFARTPVVDREPK